MAVYHTPSVLSTICLCIVLGRSRVPACGDSGEPLRRHAARAARVPHVQASHPKGLAVPASRRVGPPPRPAAALTSRREREGSQAVEERTRRERGASYPESGELPMPTGFLPCSWNGWICPSGTRRGAWARGNPERAAGPSPGSCRTSALSPHLNCQRGSPTRGRGGRDPRRRRPAVDERRANTGPRSPCASEQSPRGRRRAYARVRVYYTKVSLRRFSIQSPRRCDSSTGHGSGGRQSRRSLR